MDLPQETNAVAYGDFDGDGQEDVFVAGLSHTTDSVPVEMYLNDGNGGFRLRDDVFVGPVPRTVHTRKALSGDFNGDGKLDIFLATTGYDAPPFPGESPILILSTERGLQEATGLEHLVGFHHGAASGDVDHDGDLDIVVTNNFIPNTYLLLNDGNGVFTFDQSRLPDLARTPIFMAEILDVDGDRWPDLLLAGHEYDTQYLAAWPTTIYWGDPSGTYEDARKTVLPTVEGQQIVLDIDAEDLDGDGHREIVVNRTMHEPWYRGYYIQILAGLGGREFDDETAQRIEKGAHPHAHWLTWIRLDDINNDGHLDILIDEEDDHGLTWLNDGSGFFTPPPEEQFLVDFDATPIGDYTETAFDRDWAGRRWVIGLDAGRAEIVDGTAAYAGRSLRLKYPEGTYGSREQAIHARIALPRSYDEIHLSYRVRFGDGFDFVRGGVLPGLLGGAGRTGSDNPPDGSNGWKGHLMWRSRGAAVLNVQHPDQSDIHGDSFPLDFRFRPGRWHSVEYRFVMNDLGKKNGLLQLWLDGMEALFVKDLRFRDVDTFAVDAFHLWTFFGGGDATWATTKDEYTYFDDVVFSTESIAQHVAGVPTDERRGSR